MSLINGSLFIITNQICKSIPASIINILLQYILTNLIQYLANLIIMINVCKIQQSERTND